MKHGYGTIIYEDKSKYCGNWKNNAKEGEGEYTWSDGRIYKG